MELINSIIKYALKPRIKHIQRFMEYPGEVQTLVFEDLIKRGRNTKWGREHGYEDKLSVKEYQRRVPVQTYEEFYPYIERTLKGEENVLWEGAVKWFAQSSGTTNARSKFIPVTKEALEDCHYKAGKDLLTLFIYNKPDTKIFDGKTLSIGGSHRPNPINQNVRSGDISAVLAQNLPVWVEMSRVPKLETFLMENWEQKVEAIADATINENVTNLSGVPTWMVVILERILEKTGKNHIREVWPNVEAFAHGAVSFKPYKPIFDKLIPADDFHYLEVYNASEGFFGIQDQFGRDDMLLLLDAGIFYEFIPVDELDKDNPKAYTIEEVETDKNYAMVITTNAGLWRYMIGDTIKFTTLKPHRIKVTGRTKHFMNAFGEEVVIENADQAITEACHHTNAALSDYTAAPVYFEDEKGGGGHEWLVEFDKEPDSLETFTSVLDNKLREINSDYDAKREGNIALQKPRVHVMPKGTFYKWLEKHNKLGGQNKVPRLSNDRTLLEEIKNMASVYS